VKKLLETFTSMERVNKADGSRAKVETRSLLEALQQTRRLSGDRSFQWNAQHDPAEILSTIVHKLRDSLYWDEIATKPHTHLTCIACKKVSASAAQDQPEPFLILDPKDGMKESIYAYRDRRYEGMKCPSCGSTDVTTQNRFHKAPEVLIVQFNRSRPNGKKDQTEVKNSSSIFLTYGEGEVNLEKYMLKAVLCHKGENAGSGHYTTYAKYGNKWYYFDDHSVLKPPHDTIPICLKSKVAYMYVYEKLKRPPNQ
jgi:ubiquitin C-terminal hydrolase